MINVDLVFKDFSEFFTDVKVKIIYTFVYKKNYINLFLFFAALLFRYAQVPPTPFHLL